MATDIGAQAREAAERLRRSSNQPREAIGVRASEVAPERLRWLWNGRLAAGKLSMMDGDPGLGKSTLVIDLIARITTGRPLPGAAHGLPPRGVVLLSAEDGPADTIVPRLIAAGADLGRVYILQGVTTSEGDDGGIAVPEALDVVEATIVAQDAALLVIDPLMAYLGAETSANKDQDVRRALAPLAAMLDRTGAACLAIRHLNKATGASALYRGGGSIGIIGAARVGLLVARDPDDEQACILAPLKNNLSKPPAGLRYRLDSVPGADVARVVWDDAPVTFDASALLSAAGDEANGSELDEARKWMNDYLNGAAKPADDVLREGKKAGFSEATLRRAKRALSVVSTKRGFGCEGRWAWSLPDREVVATEDEIAKVINDPLRRASPEDEHLRQSMITLDASASESNNGQLHETIDAEYIELVV